MNYELFITQILFVTGSVKTLHSHTFNFLTENCTTYVTGFARRGLIHAPLNSEHRFHHHSMDTSSDNPCVHVL